MSILNKLTTLRGYPIVRIEDLEASHKAENFEVVSDRTELRFIDFFDYLNAHGEKVPQVEFLIRGKAGSVADGVSMSVWMGISHEHNHVANADLTVDMVENSGFCTVIDGLTWEEYTVTKNGAEVEMYDTLDAGYALIEGMKLNKLALELIKAQ